MIAAVTPVSQLTWAWRLEVVPVVMAFVALALFGQAFVRLRRRGRTDHAGWGRAVLFVAGVAALTLPLVSPLDAIADGYLLSAHMLQHLLLLDVGPALLMLALRGPLLFFFLPAAVLAPLAGIRPLRRCLGVLVRPSVAFLLWTVAIATWHVPVVYDYAVGHGAVHQLEHLSFVVVGCLVWSQLIDPARRGALSVPAGRVFYALGLIAVGHAVVHPILFGGGALYHPYLHQPHRLLGLSPLADQHWAGIVMTIDQVLTMGVCVAYLLWRDARRTRPRRVAGAKASLAMPPSDPRAQPVDRLN